jgi:dienelactone hydrolase
MKPLTKWAVQGLLLLSLFPTLAAAEVTVMPEGGGFALTAPGYQARVGADGCLTSLQVQGQEFFKSAAGFPRGVYLYIEGLLALAEVAQPEPGIITARCEQASVRYQFRDTGLTLEVTSTTDKNLQVVMVFDPGVQAGRGEAERRTRKTPLEANWPVSTWYREGVKLTLGGGSRQWGPWSGNHQVWTATVAPRGTRQITMEAGMSTPEEQAQVQEALNKVIVPPSDPTGPMWDLQRFGQAPEVFPAEGFSEPGVKALFFAGPPYDGQPTRVFAWLGVPEVKPGEKVPGMVLVHGGGGTAYANWVRQWTERGYAAIALDTCGAVPVRQDTTWRRHAHSGPPGWGGYHQIDWPREDQWAFHAVAASLLAHSLLRSLPEVDPERTGVTGISWGGYLTSLIAGVDPRYKLAVPIYGCGFTNEHNFAPSVLGLGPERAARWMRWWDPSSYLAQAPMPLLWVTGTNDFAYTLNALQKSYRQPRTPRTLAIRLRMPHGHEPGQSAREIFLFADSLLKGGRPLAKITGQGREGRQVWATFDSAVAVTKAELCFTKDIGPWQKRNWETLPATLTGSRVSAELPDGVTVYYLNLFDEREAVVSTEHEELPPAG